MTRSKIRGIESRLEAIAPGNETRFFIIEDLGNEPAIEPIEQAIEIGIETPFGASNTNIGKKPVLLLDLLLRGFAKPVKGC